MTQEGFMEQINEAAVNSRTESTQSEKRSPLRIFLLSLAVLAAIYCGLCAYASGLDTVFPGVTVYGEPLGGMTLAQAEGTLAKCPRLPDATPITGLRLTYPADGAPVSAGPVPDLSFADLGGVEIDAAASAQTAWDYCHAGNFFLKGWRFLLGLTGRSELSPALAAPRLGETAEELAQTLSLEPMNAAYVLEENAVSITIPRDGYAVTAAALTAAVQEALETYSYENFSCPVIPLAAKTLTAQEIYSQVSGETKDASYDAETESILPEHIGASFDTIQAQAAMDAAAPGDTVRIPAEITFPRVTAAQLKDLLFRDVLGEARTHVSGSAARINNVKLAAAAFNGVVLNAGDLFSYNETVGQRTEARGYQSAPAYIRGETVDEIGGGVCQPSSTLYLACLQGNLEITERYAHRYVPAYITKGMDATVSWGGPDYKFTNNTLYPVKIVTQYENGYLTVRLLGTNLDGSYVKMTYDEISVTPWKTIYEETLPPGSPEVVKTTPYTGCKVKTYQTIYAADGTVLDSHYEATSDYKVRNKVVLRPPADTPALGELTPGDGTTGSGPGGEPQEPAEPGTPGIPEDPVTPEEPVPLDPSQYSQGNF
jgi:vancomycin resistance protein YoaR